MWLRSPSGRLLVIHRDNVANKLAQGWVEASEKAVKRKLGIKEEVVVEAPPKKKRVRRSREQIEADKLEAKATDLEISNDKE